ncbi:MAG: glutathione S-transferase family protein [Holosporales bacterium]|nr:glutathione S-transferase family protein [Holosporales bacterium]
MRSLYHYWLCPFCRTVRLVLGEKGLEYALIVERYWEHRPEFTSIHPSGQVPLLVDATGEIIAGNGAIVDYLNRKYDSGTKLIGQDFQQMLEIRRLSDWFNQTFYSEVSHMMLYEKTMKRNLHEGVPDSSVIRRANCNMDRHFAYIASLLEGRNYLAGTELSLADLVAAGHISCLDYIGAISWSKHPVVKEWYAKVKSRPSFRPILDDHVPAVPPPSYYRDLDF